MDFSAYSLPDRLYAASVFAAEGTIKKHLQVLETYSNLPNVKLVVQPSPPQVIAFLWQLAKEFRRGKIISSGEMFCEIVSYVGTMPKDLFVAASDAQYQLILAVLERDFDAMKRLSKQLAALQTYFLRL